MPIPQNPNHHSWQKAESVPAPMAQTNQQEQPKQHDPQRTMLPPKAPPPKAKKENQNKTCIIARPESKKNKPGEKWLA